MQTARDIFSYRKYWAKRFGPAPFLPMSRAEMDELGWDSCDIILVTGDAYVDLPSFGMAIVGRVLEAQGFRVGIIAQPDWKSAEAFKALGRPNLYFGISAGNMDSMVNRYTADRKIRSDDAYTPGAEGGKRPDRSVIVYAQRAREAYGDVPIIIGGIEASLRRIAHYDYWSDKVRRSILLDAKADLLVYGNAERQVVEIAHRLAAKEPIAEYHRYPRHGLRAQRPAGRLERAGFHASGYARRAESAGESLCDRRRNALNKVPSPSGEGQDEGGHTAANDHPHPSPLPEGEGDRNSVNVVQLHKRAPKLDREKTVVRLPAFEAVANDPILYAHASRVMHLETNPGNARALVQRHGDRDVWLNPPPLPLTTKEMDGIYELPYQRQPHPAYGKEKIPAYEMIRFSIAIQRGCFGGCTFCSITEHEGRIIQNRSEESIIREIETIRDTVPGFHRRDLRPRRADGEHVPAALQEQGDRIRLPPALLRVSRHLPEPEHRSCAADSAVQARARAAGHQEGADRLRRALRPRRPVAGVRQGTGAAPRRRLSQDRARTFARGAAVEDDEAGHGGVLQVQGTVRQVFQGGGQGAVPDSLFHRRASGHDRRGHAGTGPVAEAERLPRRPGAGLPADPDGDRDGHVPLRQEPAAQGDSRAARTCSSRRA